MVWVTEISLMRLGKFHCHGCNNDNNTIMNMRSRLGNDPIYCPLEMLKKKKKQCGLPLKHVCLGDLKLMVSFSTVLFSNNQRHQLMSIQAVESHCTGGEDSVVNRHYFNPESKVNLNEILVKHFWNWTFSFLFIQQVFPLLLLQYFL